MPILKCPNCSFIGELPENKCCARLLETWEQYMRAVEEYGPVFKHLESMSPANETGSSLDLKELLEAFRRALSVVDLRLYVHDEHGEFVGDANDHISKWYDILSKAQKFL